jgi:hypothetical protein
MEKIREQHPGLSSGIITHISLLRECQFAHGSSAIFRKARPLLMISGNYYLKQFAKYIRRGSYNVFQFEGWTFLKSRFSLSTQIGVALALPLSSYHLPCLNRIECQLTLEM